MKFKLQESLPRRQHMKSISKARLQVQESSNQFGLRSILETCCLSNESLSNEHEDAIKLKLESLSTKLADDSLEERVTSVLHAPCLHGNWYAKHSCLTKVSDRRNRDTNCKRHAHMVIDMPERFVMAYVSYQRKRDYNAKAMLSWQVDQTTI